MLPILTKPTPSSGHARVPATRKRQSRDHRPCLEQLERRLALTDITGTWIGGITVLNDDTTASLRMSLVQTGDHVVGLEYIVSNYGPPQSAAYLLDGTFSDNTFTFQETGVTNPTPPFIVGNKSGVLNWTSILGSIYDLRGSWVSGSYSGSISMSQYSFIPYFPNLNILSAAFTPDGQNVNATYGIAGIDLPAPSTLDFNWAMNDPYFGLDPHPLGTVVSVQTNTTVGTYTTANISLNSLGPRPQDPYDFNKYANSIVITSPNTNSEAVLAVPDLALNTLTLTGQNLKQAYTITNSNLPSPATIDFYWANANLQLIGTSPAVTVSTATQESSTPYTATTSIASLGSPPLNAAYIVAIADSPFADPVLNHGIVAAPAIIAMTSASISSNGQNVQATYEIAGRNLKAAGTIDFYWANGPSLSDAIGTTPVKVKTATAVGSHTATTSLASLGAEPANASYILAVADSPSADPAYNVASVPLPATKLAVTVEPPPVVGLNTPFDVKVKAVNANGILVPGFSGPVTISLGDNPTPGSKLGRASGGTLTVNAVNGVADFPDLTLNLAGAGYTLLATSTGLAPDATVSFTAAYTPAQIRAAYGLPSLTNLPASRSGANETIAIVIPYDDPNLFDDLYEFNAKFGITQFGMTGGPNLTIYTTPRNSPLVYVKAIFNGEYLDQNGIPVGKGEPTAVPLPPSDPKWADEEVMDVEWAHTIAPAANIDVLEVYQNGSDDSLELLDGARIAGLLPNVSVVSMSWSAFGDDEVTQEVDYNSYFITPGVTYIVSSGDDSADSFGYPAASPTVVAVGGTSLNNVDAQGDYPGSGANGENGWSGSGGGVSQFEQPEPTYQLSVQKTGFRTVPDVAFDAADETGVCEYNSFTDGGSAWTVGDGTSLGAPCWAGLIAIVDQGRVAAGDSTLTSRSQTLPALYELPAGDFHKNLGGDNGTEGDIGQLANPSNFDEVTGLGTPIAICLVPGLIAWNAVSLNLDSVPRGTVGVPYSQAINASGGKGDKIVMYSIIPDDTIPPGLVFTTKANELDITGTPLVPSTVSFIVTATDPFGAYTTQAYTLIINPRNVTSQVGLTASGLVYNRGTQLFGGSMTLTNTGTTNLVGTLEIVLTGLPTGVTLANATGYTASGDPYILVDLSSGILAPGQSITLSVFFANPKRLLFQYGIMALDENS